MGKPFQRSYRPLRRAAQPWPARLCREGIFVVVLLVLVFAPLAGGGSQGWPVAVLEVAVWVGGLLWLVRLMSAGSVEWASPSAIVPGIAGLAYVWVRFGFSGPPAATQPETLLVTTAALFFMLVYSNISHRGHTSALAWVWAGLGMLIAVYGMVQVIASGTWFGEYVGAQSDRLQSIGTFTCPQHFGGFLTMTFSMTVANVFFSRRTFRQKAALLTACSLMGAAILMSVAYEAWLGMFASTVVLGIYLLRKGDYRFRWAVIGASVLIPAVLAVMVVWQGAHPAAWESGEQSTRALLWKAALGMTWDHPLFGNGPGMYAWLFPSHRTLEGSPSYASSEYLNVLADYGMAGLALVVWAVVSFAAAVVRLLIARAARYSASTLSNRYAHAIGGLAGTTAMLVQALVDFQLRAPANLFTLMALMAITLTCGVRAVSRAAEIDEEAASDAPILLGWPVRLALLATVAAILGVMGLRLRGNPTAELSLRSATIAQSKLEWSAAETLYLRAAHAEPHSFPVAVACADFYTARATWNPDQRESGLREALRWYDHALALNSYALDVLVKSARVCGLLGDRDNAYSRYKQAIQSDPDNASYHARLGLHHQRWHQLDLATAAYLRAYEIGGSDPLPEIQLRRLEAKEGS